MFTCKLCAVAKTSSEESSGHFGMCSRCHGLLINYRRNIAKTSKTPFQQQDIAAVEALVAASRQRGGYVPRYFDVEPVVCSCPMCGNRYSNPGTVSKCQDCTKREASYRSLLYRYKKQGKESKKLVDIEMFYKHKYRTGFKVPQVYLDNHIYSL